MSQTSSAPDVSSLEIPTDVWTRPFWDAAEQERIVMPHCVACGTYRWPPGPFCPACSSQQVAWTDAGQGRIYSYTIIPGRPSAHNAAPGCIVPALIEFPQAAGMRLLAAIVDTPLSHIKVGAPVSVGFSRAANGNVPVFSVIPKHS
jgi:uncharacterized OB-fold protein